jgi:AhpD family alkylhydroperoxidase
MLVTAGRPAGLFGLDGDEPEANAAAALVPDAQRAMRGLDGALWVDPLLRELVEARTAEVNGCLGRLERHACEAIELGEAPQRLAALGGWRRSPLFTERERAALALAEALALLDREALATARREAERQFGEVELAQLVFVCVAENAWDRFELGLDGEPRRGRS